MKRLWIILPFLGMFALYASALENPPSSFPSDWNRAQWIARVEEDFQTNSSGKPQWWIRTIQPFWFSPQTFRNTFFFQFSSMFQSDRSTLSPGVGYRYLLPGNSWLFGANVFYDAQCSDPLQRGSVGADIQTKWATLSGNYYCRLSGWESIHTRNGVTTRQKSLSGGDVNLSVPFPFLPWFRLGAGYYHWSSIRVAAVNGYRLYAQANLAGPLSIEGGTERDNFQHNNYFLVALRLGIPNRIQFSLWKDPVAKQVFPPRDLRRFILEPVVRESRVIFESRQTGSPVIQIGRGT